MTTPNNRVSGGRNMNHEPVCKTCPHLKADPGRWGGWCQHPSNRVIDESWPQGFTPSQGSDGGCDLHPAHVSGVPGTVNPACGVHGPIPCEGAGCTCGVKGPDHG